jgi:hypothetical protein
LRSFPNAALFANALSICLTPNSSTAIVCCGERDSANHSRPWVEIIGGRRLVLKMVSDAALLAKALSICDATNSTTAIVCCGERDSANQAAPFPKTVKSGGQLRSFPNAALFANALKDFP